MPKDKKPTTDRSHAQHRVTIDARGVVVGSEIGLTIPIDDSTAHLRFSFWHERIATDDSVEAIKEAAALVDEFNEAELERRLKKYRRIAKRELNESKADAEKKRKNSVQARAKKRMTK